MRNPRTTQPGHDNGLGALVSLLFPLLAVNALLASLWLTQWLMTTQNWLAVALNAAGLLLQIIVVSLAAAFFGCWPLILIATTFSTAATCTSCRNEPCNCTSAESADEHLEQL